ncbi:hypothetical protein KR009_002958, partial [Drosophila setifemur]
MIGDPKTLLIGAYAIGIFDLISASFFFIVSFRAICNRLSWLTIFAVAFGIFWVSMIVMLLLGIHGRNPKCLKTWITFSCCGILVETILLLYAVLSESTFQTGLFKNILFLAAGLFVESIFLFVIHRFYVTLSFCQKCNKPRKTSKDNVHPNITTESKPKSKSKSNQSHKPKSHKKPPPQIQHSQGRIVQNSPS